jgi:hypothetical protein
LQFWGCGRIALGERGEVMRQVDIPQILACTRQGQQVLRDVLTPSNVLAEVGKRHVPLCLHERKRPTGGIAISDYNLFFVCNLIVVREPATVCDRSGEFVQFYVRKSIILPS